jgi:hypothetical protein
VLAPACCERAWSIGDDTQRVDEVAMAMRMVLPVNVLGCRPARCASGPMTGCLSACSSSDLDSERTLSWTWPRRLRTGRRASRRSQTQAAVGANSRG